VEQQAVPILPGSDPLLDSTNSPWVGLKLQHYRIGESDRPDVTTNAYLAALCLNGCYKTEYLPGSERKGFKVAWKPGDVFLTGPGDLPARRSRGRIECLVLEVAPKYILWAADELAATAPFEVRPVWSGKDEQLRHLMLTLYHELLAHCPSGRLFGEYMGLSFATSLLTRYSSAQRLGSDRGGLTPYRLRQAIAFINDNLATDLSLAAMATLVHMTPNGFARAFKVSTGVSPHQYILRRRIERGLRMLKQAPVNLAALAYELGFSSQGHFSQVFRTMVGVTPGSYRAQLLSLKDLEAFPAASPEPDTVTMV